MIPKLRYSVIRFLPASFDHFVIQIHALVPVVIQAGKVIIVVMMITTIVVVNGMEETVVEVMLTQIFVQLVNVLILHLPHLVNILIG